jgi:hypothetical protein
MSKLAKVHAAARARTAALTTTHTVGAGLAGGLLGAFEKRGHSLPQIDGLPLDGKGQWALGLALVSDSLPGKVGRYARSVADGLAAIAAYEYMRR